MSTIDLNKCLPYVPAKSGNAIVPYHCTFSSIGGILRYHGYENLDLVMCKEYDFYYRSNPVSHREQKAVPVPAVHCFTHFERHLREIDQINMRAKHMNSGHSVQEQLEQRLAQNEPLLVMLDQYYLPHYRYNFMYSHFFHMCILIGLDRKNSTTKLIEYEHVFVKNTFMIEFVEKDVGLPDFLHALHSAGNTVYEFQFPETPAPYHESTLQRILRMATDIMLDNNHYAGIFAGISGIRALAQDLLSWSHQSGGDPKAGLAQILDPMQLQTLATQRKWFSTFLHGAAAALQEKRLENCSSQLNEICEHWVVVRNMLVKAGKQNAEEILPRISKRLMTISDQEEHCATTLRGLVGTN